MVGDLSVRRGWPGLHDPGAAVQRDRGGEQRRYREAEPEPHRILRADERERDARREAQQRLGRHAHAVGAEVAGARERAARQVLDPEREQRDHEAHDEADVVGEQARDE